MTKDEHLSGQEEACQDAREERICRDAAILVTQGYSRAAALSKAEEIQHAQDDADGDVTGATATLAECQSPKLTPGTEAQVAAIAAELFQQRN